MVSGEHHSKLVSDLHACVPSLPLLPLLPAPLGWADSKGGNSWRENQIPFAAGHSSLQDSSAVPAPSTEPCKRASWTSEGTVPVQATQQAAAHICPIRRLPAEIQSADAAVPDAFFLEEDSCPQPSTAPSLSP